MEIHYTLRLPRDTATVPLVRTICRDAMTRLGVSSSCRSDVALALTEACPDYDRGRGIALMHLLVDRSATVTSYSVTDRHRPGDTGRGPARRIAFDSQPENGTVVHLEKTLELDEHSLLRALAF
jgi:hypothetical protein